MPQQTRPEYRAVWTGNDGVRQASDSSLTLESIKSIALDHQGTIEVSHGSGWEPYNEPQAAPAAPATPATPETPATPATGSTEAAPTA